MKQKKRLVYSTASGRLCPECLRAKTECSCGRSKRLASSSTSEYVYLRRETKGRKGAGVTVISELNLDATEMKALAKSLKKLCGVGGAIKEGKIEIQGDQREKIKIALEAQGMKVKLSGG